MKQKRQRELGFTLIELLVVVIVLAVLAATIVPQFTGVTYETKVSTARTNMKAIENALERFSIDNDRYPTAEEGLAVLTKPPKPGKSPYLKELIPDPWGKDYVYACPGTEGRTYDLYSLGADGENGGTEQAEDITLWHKKADENG